MASKVAQLERKEDPQPRHRHVLKVIPQGENGHFSQSWYPICRSSELEAGQVIARPFLDGQVAVYRTEAGEARVVSSYCVHMGADLSGGRVVGDTLQCAFHGWQYGEGGRCVRTKIGAKAPKSAAIFAFPTRERWGLIFAFNGDEALWELPDLDRPDDELMVIERPVVHLKCDPEMITANAFDWQHFATLHDFHAKEDADPATIQWGRYDTGYVFEGYHWLGEETTYKIHIYGTNIYTQQGSLDGYWYAMLNPMGIPRTGECIFYMQILVPRGEDTQAARTFADYKGEALADMEMRFIAQDIPILNKLHFAPGHLLKEDKQFAQFLDWLKRYPRANPAMNYLR